MAPVQRSIGENEWRCPRCGRVNQKYVGTCGCGQEKPDYVGKYVPLKPVKTANRPAQDHYSAQPQHKSDGYYAYYRRSAGTNEWKCPKCGKINQNYVGTCGCGQQKPR